MGAKVGANVNMTKIDQINATVPNDLTVTNAARTITIHRRTELSKTESESTINVNC